MVANKVKIGAMIGAILMVLRLFLPDIDVPDGLQDSLMLIIIFVAQFFIKESPATVARMKLKG